MFIRHISISNKVILQKNRSIRLFSSNSITQKLNFYNFNEFELVELFKSWQVQPFRAKQVYKWVYDKGVTDFSAMADIPVDLRTRLSNMFQVGTLTIASEQISKDGTIKRAYALHDNQLIEAVLMPYEDGRSTACISSQAGCAMGCVFCATGKITCIIGNRRL